MFNTWHTSQEPTRDEVNQMTGPVLVEFGTGWCGYCRSLQPHLAKVMEGYPTVRHLKIEDGKGRPLGRSFGVKLWPTLVFLLDGQMLHKAIRPQPEEIREGFEKIAVRNPVPDLDV